MDSATFAPHPLHRVEQAEPVALGRIGEAVQLDGVLAHHGLDEQAGGGGGRGERAERAGGGLHQVADAVHVEHAGGVGELLDAAGEEGDHAGVALRWHAMGQLGSRPVVGREDRGDWGVVGNWYSVSVMAGLWSG